MGNVIIVIISSVIIAFILNKVTEKTNIKEKCEELVDDKGFLKFIPVLFIVMYFVILKFIAPMLGLGVAAVLITQVICLTGAVYTFELFNM